MFLAPSMLFACSCFGNASWSYMPHYWLGMPWEWKSCQSVLKHVTRWQKAWCNYRRVERSRGVAADCFGNFIKAWSTLPVYSVFLFFSWSLRRAEEVVVVVEGGAKKEGQAKQEMASWLILHRGESSGITHCQQNCHVTLWWLRKTSCF